MTITSTRIRLLLTAAVAALALTGGAVQSASAAGSVKKATKLLQDTRLTIYDGGRITNTTIKRDFDLCRGGSLYYYSEASSSEFLSTESAQGRWRVVSASVRGGYGWAKVRWRAHTSSGDTYSGTNRVSLTRRGVYVDRTPVEVTRSPAC